MQGQVLEPIPSNAVDEVEEHLTMTQAMNIDVDILQVGHHGSMTSSRGAFIDAVDPTHALISVGPKKYGSVILPDDEVVDYLLNKSVVILRTDISDGKCPVDDRIGRNSTPGGCTNYVLDW